MQASLFGNTDALRCLYWVIWTCEYSCMPTKTPQHASGGRSERLAVRVPTDTVRVSGFHVLQHGAQQLLKATHKLGMQARLALCSGVAQGRQGGREGYSGGKDGGRRSEYMSKPMCEG